MQNLRHITSEKDLKLYEEYLENDCTSCKPEAEELSCSLPPVTNRMIKSSPASLTHNSGCVNSNMFFQGYLKNHIGKLVRVESLLANRLEVRIGVLFEVGANYIVIKLFKSTCTMMIEASSIKYITIIHDNDVNKSMVY